MTEEMMPRDVPGMTEEQLVNLYADLSRYARYQVRAEDVDLIEDVVQETMVAFVKRVRQGLVIEKPLAFAYTILRHQLLSEYKAHSRTIPLVIASDDESSQEGISQHLVIDESADLERLVISREQLVMLEDVLQKLSPRDQAVMRGVRSGLTIQELAQALGIHGSAVRAIVSRARARMSNLLRQEEILSRNLPEETSEEKSRPDPAPEERLRWWRLRNIHRPVFELFFGERLTVAQIAQRLHYAEGTVRCYLSRGGREEAAPPRQNRVGRPRRFDVAHWQWIDQVSSAAQRVLRLYYRQRLELSVIAQICGITVQEVRALLKQGRIELRKLGTETEVVRGRPRHELEPLQQKYLEYLEHMHLSAIYVEVLHLYYREQKRMEDIAVKLDLSVGTVKSRLARGRAAFHEHALAYERWEACGGSLCQEVQMT